MKVVVICGPDLQTADAVNWLVTSHLPQPYTLKFFPEHDMGAEATRHWVTEAVQHPKCDTLVIITRYEAALFQLGALVELKEIGPGDVYIHLLHERRWLSVQFNEKGHLQEPWPIGVLS